MTPDKLQELCDGARYHAMVIDKLSVMADVANRFKDQSLEDKLTIVRLFATSPDWNKITAHPFRPDNYMPFALAKELKQIHTKLLSFHVCIQDIAIAMCTAIEPAMVDSSTASKYGEETSDD